MELDLNRIESQIDQLHDLADRLENAIVRLDARRTFYKHGSKEDSRLIGKIEGVTLSLSYVEEMLRDLESVHLG